MFNLLLLYAFFTPLVGQINFFSPPFGTLDILFPITIFILFQHLSKGKIRKSILSFFLIFFLTDVLISLIWLYLNYGINTFLNSFLRTIRLFEMFIPFFLCFSMNINREELRKYITTFMISGLVSLIAGIVIFIFQIPIKEVTQTYNFNGYYLMRAGGLYGNTGPYGLLIAIWTTIGILYSIYFVKRQHLKILLLLTILLLSSVNILISLSRMAVLFICSSLFIWISLEFLTLKKKNIKSTIYFTFTIISFIIAVFSIITYLYPSAQTILYKRFIENTLLASNLSYVSSGRIDIWKQYIIHIWDNPITGIGYKGIYFALNLPPDNNYLSLLTETGLLGFINIAIFHLIIIYFLFKRSIYFDDIYAKIGLSLLLGLLISAFTADVLTFWNVIPVLYIYIGLVINSSDRNYLSKLEVRIKQ